MPVATTRKVANGYIVTSQGQPPEIPTTQYAATLEEVVFWINAIFTPPAPPPSP